jgi:hypothetical protein
VFGYANNTEIANRYRVDRNTIDGRRDEPRTLLTSTHYPGRPAGPENANPSVATLIDPRHAALAGCARYAYDPIRDAACQSKDSRASSSCFTTTAALPKDTDACGERNLVGGAAIATEPSDSYTPQTTAPGTGC